MKSNLEAKARQLYYLMCGYKENWKPEYKEEYDKLEKELYMILDELDKLEWKR